MKWLIQELLNNSNYTRILSALERTHTDYLMLQLNKDNQLVVLDKTMKVPIDNSDEQLARFLTDESIMLYGSKSFVQLPLFNNLRPGSFSNEKFEYEVFRKVLGNELLNNKFEVNDLWNLNPKWNEFFIRPTGNTKLFTGMKVSLEEFKAWQLEHSKGESPYTNQSLMIAPVQIINSEYRFFIVNQEIVTASSYKIDGQVNIGGTISKEMMEYVHLMINKFPLSMAFVIDIAVTDKGFKVVEYNNLNTSGLYGCNEIHLVQAINELK